MIVLFKRRRLQWPSGKSLPRDQRVAGSNLIPPKIHHVWGLHAKSYVVAKHPPVGMAKEFGEGRCQLRCRPRHLTAVQNYEVHS
ncbi:hypothetical protein AVEN_142021-1 [Araneus ventricosus]|uniref:Uncharacterized protein n=1 Tax=Araneus ventricosus TaxID=182803 RepID=A0A4Y2LFK8_ARAVE|nr:hypothetical protein AVEN_142021-1 [Araneus ventricosus]